MKWFGPPWPSEEHRSSVCQDDGMKTETPVGRTCPWCQESILDGESGVWFPHWSEDGPGPTELPWHRECSFRMVMGSKAHAERRCPCFGGDSDEDPEMTSRQEAQWVYNYWTMQGVMP